MNMDVHAYAVARNGLQATDAVSATQK